ncbi:hypothetical protein K443DRAFT_120295 [Laccaria amethystina LaAM-08-1]|uniref:Unplaced genomic scaffold K443scaffold_20, whole genome shotgun sequence n=1 Tax=Laccaria amethystina LaAM-08-1 TaxID=1095629 RepID=A0A0C9X1W1_9AGAR|nr:hypothetical protein K443DRAFT_120295 [Laccaria amethystina LaAM-08-1]
MRDVSAVKKGERVELQHLVSNLHYISHCQDGYGSPKSFQDLKKLFSRDAKEHQSKDKFLSASSDGFGFRSVIFRWDIHDTVDSRELLISNKANGYTRDILASIDLSSFRRIPWENDVPSFLVSFLDPDTKQPIVVDPRLVTRDMSVLLGSSMRDAGSVSKKNFTDLQPLTPETHGYSLLRTQLNNQCFHDLFDKSWQFHIPIEGHHESQVSLIMTNKKAKGIFHRTDTETGPGVLETALAYSSALRIADNAILFNYTAKKYWHNTRNHSKFYVQAMAKCCSG